MSTVQNKAYIYASRLEEISSFVLVLYSEKFVSCNSQTLRTNFPEHIFRGEFMHLVSTCNNLNKE
jgi:hypothetical protein